MKGANDVLFVIFVTSISVALSSVLKCRRRSPVGYHSFGQSLIDLSMEDGTEVSLSRFQRNANTHSHPSTSFSLPQVLSMKMHHPRIHLTMRRTQLPLSTNYRMIVVNSTGHREVPTSLRDSCLYSTENGSAHGVSAILNLCSERLLIDVLIGRRSYAILPPSNMVGQLNESFCVYVKYHKRKTTEQMGQAECAVHNIEKPLFLNDSHFSEHREPVFQQKAPPPPEFRESKRRAKRSQVTGVDKKVFPDNYYIVELVLIVDKTYFVETQEQSLVESRVASTIARANDLFHEVNVVLALVGLIVWEQENQIPYPDDPLELSRSLLDSLAEYKTSFVNGKYHLDALHLLTGIQLIGRTGASPLDSMCDTQAASSVSTDAPGTSFEAAASSMVHHLSHVFGLADDRGCTCGASNEECIMYFSRTPSDVNTVWSDCSRRAFQNIFQKNLYSICLQNFPDIVPVASSCGNYLIEEGEECDCGPAQRCSNPCCEPMTCQRKPQTQCAGGACCDLNTCQFQAEGTICRTGVNPLCDFSEMCSGFSPECPEDNYAQAGTPCETDDNSYSCFQGSCVSPDAQCKFLYGPTARIASVLCFNLNTDGATHGACTLRYMDSENNEALPCEEKDKLCGQIHCVVDAFSTDPPVLINFGSYVREQAVRALTIRGEVTNCPYVFFTLDYGLEFVPEGSKCGDSSYCRNRKCVPLPAVEPCPSGTIRDSAGECITPPCPAGTIRDSAGECVTPPCPSGTMRGPDGQCVPSQCPNGTARADDGHCLSSDCQNGTIRDEEGECVSASSSCAEGRVENQFGECIPYIRVCPIGTRRSTDGRCRRVSSKSASSDQMVTGLFLVLLTVKPALLWVTAPHH